MDASLGPRYSAVMLRRHPEASAPDDGRVYDRSVARRRSATRAVGVRSGLFDALAVAPQTEAALAERFGWSPRATRSLLTALSAMGLVERSGTVLRLADDAAAYLVRGRPGSLWALIDLEVEHFLSPATLLEAMRRDRASVYGGADPWEAHRDDPERARAFTQ